MKAAFALCIAVEVILFCSVWYKLRTGKARIGGLSVMLTSLAWAALLTSSDLYQSTLRHAQVYLALVWFAVNIWGYISLSREDKEAIDKQQEEEVK